MSEQQLNEGAQYSLRYTVTTADLAKTLSISAEDDFPEVLATSRMVALMELAAARLMKPLLSADQLSVGVNVNVNHMAATPLGAEVTAIATFKGKHKAFYLFDVELHDAGGLAGKGEHSRAIIQTERLLEGARKRG